MVITLKHTTVYLTLILRSHLLALAQLDTLRAPCSLLQLVGVRWARTTVTGRGLYARLGYAELDHSDT
jgi:hypothetical protein